jgi:hypothetical protein
MIIALRRACTLVAVFSLASLAAVAAAQTSAPTALDKQLERVDLGITGMGLINSKTSGPAGPFGYNLTDTPSNTGGVLINLRYIKSPLVGFEFNYTYARNVQNYNYYVQNDSPNETPVPAVLNLQDNMHEYSFGWVFHTPRVFGIGTFASAGAGTTAFKPTAYGGENVTEQARMSYYYNVGVEQNVINNHLGVRAAFRQAFYLAPDFQTSFLRDYRHTSSIEPNIGFYIRF